jgi:hypothetical protein
MQAMVRRRLEPEAVPSTVDAMVEQLQRLLARLMNDRELPPEP